MFSRSKNSTTSKIELISSLWSVLIIAMLATTFTLYHSQNASQNGNAPQLTLRDDASINQLR
jgi:hypothetical protein